jgi:hypothetical protein
VEAAGTPPSHPVFKDGAFTSKDPERTRRGAGGDYELAQLLCQRIGSSRGCTLCLLLNELTGQLMAVWATMATGSGEVRSVAGPARK